MKIVLGVCGFGFGHSIRQRPILEGLIARGHQVILITNDYSHQFFAQHYPQVRLVRVYVPVMHTTPRGLDFAATANDPRNVLPDANPAFWNACGLIEREFGTPDLVISDYDMVSAQIAYLFGVPLVTLDQQSKFLGYDFPDISGYSPNEHQLRLGYFFPKAKSRVATTFFKVNYPPIPDFPVTIIPPIIGQDVKSQVIEPRAKQVTVYISAASQIQQSLDELVAVFSSFPDYLFFCFVEGRPSQLPANVFLKANTRAAFLACLCQSLAVLSTAGHNLITEALYLYVPMFLLPFAHYEQQLNAHIIASEGLGYSDSIVSHANLREFLNSLDLYRHRESALIYRQFDGDTVFLDFIETR
ncbi:MAG TPA: glycosyltransferase family protein [Aggregatilineaceae bacterium]|nr:glycosyltransferase family protein [Aggregatilineaceae bacterium]